MQQIAIGNDGRCPEASHTGNIVKKSHARKRPEGHIPRPSNAFILFRTDFVLKKRIPPSIEKDQTNISRIAGKVWQQMSDKEKKPWKRMAVQEKHKHQLKYPEYMPTKRRPSMNGAASEEAQEDVSSREQEGAVNPLDSMGSNPFSKVIAPWEPLIEHTHPGFGESSLGLFEINGANDYSREAIESLEGIHIRQYQQHARSGSWIHDIPTQDTFTISDAHGSVGLDNPFAVSDARVNVDFYDPSRGITQYPFIYSNAPSESPHNDIPMDVDAQDEHSHSWNYRVSAERFAPGTI